MNHASSMAAVDQLCKRCHTKASSSTGSLATMPTQKYRLRMMDAFCRAWQKLNSGLRKQIRIPEVKVAGRDPSPMQAPDLQNVRPETVVGDRFRVPTGRAD